MSGFSIDFEASLASLKKAVGQEHPYGAVNLFSPAGTLFIITLLQVTRLPLEPRWGIVTSVMTIAIDLFAGIILRDAEVTRRTAGAVIPFVYLLYFNVNPLMAATYVSIETVARLLLHLYFKKN